MANTTTAGITFTTLGQLAKGRGKLGPTDCSAKPAQLEAGQEVIARSTSYGTALMPGVTCMDDRLGLLRARLAGGALSQALMWNFLYGGRLFSENLLQMRPLFDALLLHKKCGALELASATIAQRLTDVNTPGYGLLKELGVDVSAAIRRRIADWAAAVPGGYFDTAAAIKVVGGAVPVEGPHAAPFAIIDTREGESFAAAELLGEQTDGLKTFVVTPWAALRDARVMTTSEADATVASIVALLFTAEVFMELCDSDVIVAIR